MTADGFRQPIAAVGKIFRQDSYEGTDPVGGCSATLVANGYIITAAHCLYANDTTAPELTGAATIGFLQNQINLYFVPDASANGTGTDPWTNSNRPDGALRIVNSWVPTCWQDQGHGGSDDGACDYGLAEIAPYTDGTYAGQYTGIYPLIWNYVPTAGTAFYLMGYPASGLRNSSQQCTAGFCTQQEGFGDAPAYCQDNFDGNYDTSTNDSADARLIGSGYYMPAPGCFMNGGASGGPVFTQHSGQWYVNGVNNIGTNSLTTGFGTTMSWNWWSSRFGQFFCGLLPNRCS